MTKKIVLEFEDTPEIREVLSTLGVHCFCDVAPEYEDYEDQANQKMAEAAYLFNDVVTIALHPEVLDVVAEIPLSA